jgi:serine/threonine protein phosphatase 1
VRSAIIPHEIFTLDDEDNRIFVIGDIHGCVDELHTLLEYLITNGLNAKDNVIFLGDYIDRGPASKQVIEELLTFKNNFPKTVFLKGNHEDMFLDFLGFGGNLGDVYLANGGLNCLRSFNIPVNEAKGSKEVFLSENILTFLLGLKAAVKHPKYFFAHAGVNPDIDLELQSTEDLFWIRDKFVFHPHSFIFSVIFGHTPFKRVFMDLPYKIGIDTGLVYGNLLSCIELTEKRLIQIERASRRVFESEL